MRYVVAILAAVIGAMLGGSTGFLFGGLFGIAFVVWRQRYDLAELRAAVAALGAPAEAPEAPGVVAAAPVPDAILPTTPPEPREPSAIGVAAAGVFDAVRRFFTSGNVVVRVGVVVLFFGVAFLLRYAYENAWLPIELRLAGSALGGIALAAAGWRLRHRSDTYGVVLQGAGVGILYLTVFAAARLYELLPMSAAFVMLVVLVAASSVMAVVQNAQSLALFAMSGGFLAPVLTSTGAGSHVALFSYYALLNAGIFAMAWFRHWRWLNWVGFVFTFVIGALWGRRYYTPEHFASTEPFLVLFFLYYLGVSVMFARRREVNLRGVVDGTLVFGTPLAAFALQAALVADLPFGLAFSALGTAVVYTLLALWLRSQGAFTSVLGQSFLALGVGFATLAIPFAFDDQRWTAASWALEGAGLMWVGLRQHQRLPRVAGMLLQIGAGIAFFTSFGDSVAPRLFLNSAWLGAAMLSIAGGITSRWLSEPAAGLHRWEHALRWWFLGWAVVWWLAGGAREIDRFDPPWYEQFVANDVREHLFVLFSAASFAVLAWLARRYEWREALAPGFLLLPLAVAVAILVGIDGYHGNPLADLGWLAWPAAVAAVLWHLRPRTGFPRLEHLWHAGCWWFSAFVLAWIGAATVDGVLSDSAWSTVLWGLVPLAAVGVLLRSRTSTRWPFADHRGSYSGWGTAAMFGYLLVWMLAAGTTAAHPAPLPYIPIANPLDLASIAILLVGVLWTRTPGSSGLAPFVPVLRAMLGISGFAWLNLAAARAVHFYAGVDYPLGNIVESDAFLATATILWTSTALVLMGVGTRRGLRPSWIVGAALLALVLVKLFTVDLSNLDVVARIVSFLTVGVLMLVIGYFAPLPPSRRAESVA